MEVPPLETTTPEPVSGGTQEDAEGTFDEPQAEDFEDFTEDDVMFISTSVWTLPALISEDIPSPDDHDLQQFNHHLYRYCKRKGINPFDYLFDELPLALAAITMGGKMYNGYQINHQKRIQAENLGEPAQEMEDLP